MLYILILSISVFRGRWVSYNDKHVYLPGRPIVMEESGFLKGDCFQQLSRVLSITLHSVIFYHIKVYEFFKSFNVTFC